MAHTATPAFISKQVLDGRYFFLDLIPSQRADITVVCGGKERCSPTYEIERENFQYYVIEFVAEGKGELWIEKQRFHLKPGSIFAYGPGIFHRIRSHGSKTLVKYFVCFAGSQAESMLKDSGLTTQHSHQLIRTRWIHDIYDQLLDSGMNTRRIARRQCLLLLRLLFSRLEVDAHSVEEAASEAYETYCRCRHYIEDQFKTIVTIREAACACHVDPAYLSRLFHRFSQEGPYQYLTRLKMDFAADLFVQSDLSVMAAAQSLGYADPYHFSRVFKRIHGIAPSTFARSVTGKKRM